MIAVSNLLKGESIFFRYSVYVGENSFDLKQVAIISAETCQMVLNLILASICIENNWGDEKILVIPVTWQISAQPLVGGSNFWKIKNRLISTYSGVLLCFCRELCKCHNFAGFLGKKFLESGLLVIFLRRIFTPTQFSECCECIELTYRNV